MRAEVRRATHTLDAWRAEGADLVAPVRFHYIDALLQRAQQLHGDARRVLDEKIDVLLGDYATRVAASTTTRDASAATADGDDTLASLTRLLAERRDPSAGSPHEGAAASPVPASVSNSNALAEAQKIWTDVRTRSQVRQSLEQTAEDAGPLNSSRLVHRAIQFMGDCSPAYREHFLIYLDTLSWLQQMGQHGVLSDNTTSPPPGRKPRKPRKPRSKPPSADEA